MKRMSCDGNRLRRSVVRLTAVCVAAMWWGCVNDGLNSADAERFRQCELTFGARVDNGIANTTRADETAEEEADRFKLVDNEHFKGVKFYIYEEGYHKENSNDPENLWDHKAAVLPYIVGSADMGRLSFAQYSEKSWGFPTTEKYEKLNWFSSDTPHMFWSWTWPLANKTQEYLGVKIEEDEKIMPANELLLFFNSEFPISPAGSTGTGTGSGSGSTGSEADTDEPEIPEEWNENTWNNGVALENLVGARTDRQYQFNVDGHYVPLTYKHLVSKILLKKFWLVDRTGAERKDLKGKITFYGMPKRAILYTMPNTKDENGFSVAPFVAIDSDDPYNKKNVTDRSKLTDDTALGPWEYDINEGLTFYINNPSGDAPQAGQGSGADEDMDYDVFYICPEVDFNKLEFKVEFVEPVFIYAPEDKKQEKPIGIEGYVPHHEYGMRGGFFGDFSGVQFKREGWHDEEGSDNPVDGPYIDRVLHAGEVMELSMTVYEKSGPGAGVWIRNWSTNKLKPGTYHDHNGIYSDADASAFRDLFGYGYDSNIRSRDQRVDAYDNLYGEDEWYPEYEDKYGDQKRKVVHIYDDITVSSDHFRLYFGPGETGYDSDYVILDGMGHIITFYDSTQTLERFRIGKVRDIYVSNGETTIYIDENFRICRYNEKTGEYEWDGEEVWTGTDNYIYFNKK